jgi:hypothetical protein
VGAGKRDRLRGFAALDKFDLTAVDANATVAGDQAFALIKQAPFSKPGQVRWQFVGTITLVQMNTDADLQPEFEVELTNRAALTVTNFLP